MLELDTKQTMQVSAAGEDGQSETPREEPIIWIFNDGELCAIASYS